jgi:putative nucleotidyltransferase with HDIG domain
VQALKEKPVLRIDKNIEIPSIPLVLIKIIRTLNENTASAKELEELIHHDPALSARILRLANSAFYSFRNEVKTISHAIALLGMNLVTSLAIGIKVFDTFMKGTGSQAVLINKLWMHSCGVAVFSKEIWNQHNSKKEGEFAFLCGLLHDLGKIIFFQTHTSRYASTFAAKRAEDDPSITIVEMETYGMDHTIAGEMLAKQWGLPPELADVIRRHHDETALDNPLIGSVMLADLLAKRLGIGYDGDKGVESDLDKLRSVLSVNDAEYEYLMEFASRERGNLDGFFRASI